MNSVDLLNGSGNSIGPHIFPVLKCEISWFDQRIHTKKTQRSQMFRDTKKRTKFDHISIKTIACVKGFSTECNSWFEYISFEWHCFAFSSLLFHFIFSLLLLHCFQYDEPFSFFCLILIYALFFHLFYDSTHTLHLFVLQPIFFCWILFSIYKKV